MQWQPDNIFSKRILISPLDWGMGHTARCVSIIRQLIGQKNTIYFAGNEAQCSFMKREFPQIQVEFIDGYNVTLDSKKSSYLQMINQLIKIKKSIKAEHLFVEKFVSQEKIDVVISDNRYGFFSEKTKNIFLAHQLNLQLPFLSKFVNSQLKSRIEKFDCIWIPDSKSEPVCGDLTNAKFDIPKIVIGHLCRFENIPAPIKYEYLGIVSGPEPERSRFANVLAEFLAKKNQKAALVGAKVIDQDIHCIENPSTIELQELINSSSYIVSRAGYTTIMEMLVLKKNAILIPTPNQFEQEYLAKNIHSGLIQFIDEKEFITS